MDLPASLRFPKNRFPPGWAGFCFWRRVQDSTCSAEQAASGCGYRLAVPEKPFESASILRFFDRCRNCALPFSAPGSGSTQFPRVRILLFFEKKLPARMGGELLLAEGAGFEPAWAFALTVFKTAPL